MPSDGCDEDHNDEDNTIDNDDDNDANLLVTVTKILLDTIKGP